MISHLRPHVVTLGAALVAALFILFGRVTPRTAARAIDVDLLLVLFALLVTVEILRASGYLDVVVHAAVDRFGTTRGFALGGASLYVTAIATSQLISNVPATVLLSPLAGEQWRELLYGVSAGGCGTIIASLANLLGWRIYVRESNRDPRFFRHLTVINAVFLAWAAAGG